MLELNKPKDVTLTEKEIEVLALICEEKSTKEIATTLKLSPRTVEGRRDKIKDKTGAKGYAGLVIFAYRAGIVS